VAARNAFIALIATVIILPAACAQNAAPSKPDATVGDTGLTQLPDDQCPAALEVCKKTVGSASRTTSGAKSTQNICEDKADAGAAVHPHAADIAKVGFFGQGQDTCKSELVECEKIRSTVVKDMADALDSMGKACGYSK